MPRNQGTSRKGKPGKKERAAGMGKALQRAQNQQRSRNGGKMMGVSHHHAGGMALPEGVAPNNRMVLEDMQTRSVLELDSLDDFLLQADMAQREFVSERGGYGGYNGGGGEAGLHVLEDAAGHVYRPDTTTAATATTTTDFSFAELSVPRRPAWTVGMSREALEAQEQQAFLEWRRTIAAREDQLRVMQELQQQQQASTNATNPLRMATVTPFEKNLQVWRQLWRVLERSGCLLQLVDARNPLFYLSDDLREYATTVLGKPMMVLINKSDYLSAKQRAQWRDYLQQERGYADILFFSAVQEQQKLDQAAQQERRRAEEAYRNQSNILNDEQEEGNDNNEEDEGQDNEEKPEEEEADEDKEEDNRATNPASSDDSVEEKKQVEEDTLALSQDSMGVDVPLTRQQLLDAMLAFARKHDCRPDPRYDHRIQFGMVGFPNVGKSSVINVLVGSSKHAHGITRVGVAAQPGKTKHFQTLLLPDVPDMMLCDCPGLVFPSFVSNTADLIAAGVYPIAQMRDPWPVIQLICQRIPRTLLNAQYGIRIPEPNKYELREQMHYQQPQQQHGEMTTEPTFTLLPPPTAEEFLETLCVARGMLAASSGLPDFQRAARMVIQDYATGKLLYCHPPPNVMTTSNPATREDFYQETFQTALKNTQKLRDKLLKQQQQQQDEKRGDHETEPILETNDSPPSLPEDDPLLLDMLGVEGSAASTNGSNGGGNSQKMGKKQRKGRQKATTGGKKDHKNRDKDPYGCHSTPDDAIMTMTLGSAAVGVTVNAGKYGRSGYTRPTGYGNARGGQASGV